MKQSRRALRERFVQRSFAIAVGFCLLLWTTVVILQEHADYYFGYDLETLRPTDALVRSFIESVHTNDPAELPKESPVNKWVKPIVISYIGGLPEWHRLIIAEHTTLLKKLTGLEINEVSSNDQPSTLKIFFVQGKKAILEIGQKITLGDWKEDFVGQFRCFAVYHLNEREEITEAFNIIAWSENNSRTRRCLIEELTQAIGPGSDNATYRPSIFSNHFPPVELSINDKILVRTLYDKRIKPGMTREQTTPLARKIIEELVAAVKERGEEALYQR